MGYSTEFKGSLKFTKELTASQLAYLKTFLGQDCREHPEWDAEGMTYINLKLTDDFSGLTWDGSEKTYELVEKVNLIIDQMQKKYPEFGLQGELSAQGEEYKDIWVLSITAGRAVRKELVMEGREVECPHCECTFILDAQIKAK